MHDQLMGNFLIGRWRGDRVGVSGISVISFLAPAILSSKGLGSAVSIWWGSGFCKKQLKNVCQTLLTVFLKDN